MPWRRCLEAHPFGSAAAVAAIVLGGLGAVLGADVSAGMRNTLAHTADAFAHAWGIMFALGGVLKLIGLYRHRLVIEIPGLWLLTGGFTFYSLTVVAGLGLAGIAAGTISAALAFGCLLKVRYVMRAARLMSGGGRGQDGPR